MIFSRVRSYFRKNGSFVRSHNRKTKTTPVQDPQIVTNLSSGVKQLSEQQLPTIPKQPTYDEWELTMKTESRKPSDLFTDDSSWILEKRRKEKRIREEFGVLLDEMRKVTAAWPPTTAIPTQVKRFSAVNDFGNCSSECAVLDDGSAVVQISWTPASSQGIKPNPETGEIETFYRTVFFFPGVDLSNDRFKAEVCIPGANLQGANFEETKFDKVFLDGADLRGTKWRGALFMRESSMNNVDLRGADLSGDMTKVDLSGANLEGVDLSRTHMPADLRGIDLSDEQIKQIENVSGDMSAHIYNKMSFEQAIEELGIEEKQFEFLVVSGVIEVRDNRTRKIVRAGYDPELHHVPFWSLNGAKKAFKNSELKMSEPVSASNEL